MHTYILSFQAENYESRACVVNRVPLGVRGGMEGHGGPFEKL